MKFFFIIGPNRTGTSLLTRCVSDHPNCLCMWESYISRLVYDVTQSPEYRITMIRNGLLEDEISKIESKIIKNNKKSMLKCYKMCYNILSKRYSKDVKLFGDKDPRFYWSPFDGVIKEKIDAISDFKQICTIRDPRAVFNSGERYKKNGRVMRTGKESLEYYLKTYESIKKYENNNILFIKYEDLILKPEDTMNKVYGHIGLPYNDDFMKRKSNEFDGRFWWHKDVIKQFKEDNIDKWKKNIVGERLKKINSMHLVKDILRNYYS